MKLLLEFNQFILEAEDTYSDYPAAAKANAKKAIDWKEKYGRDEVKGGTAVGWQRAHQLAKGEKLSRDVVSRMAQFNRHRKNSKIAPEYKDEPWKDNGYIAWLIWGGDEGVDWAMKKMDEIQESIKPMKRIKLFEEFVTEVRTSPTSGTKAGWITSLEDRKYELKKPVKGVKIGSFTNQTLPKGTIIHNLPGGVFAMHPELEDKFKLTYSSQAPRWHHTFGVLVTSLPETLEAIEKNGKVLESVNENLSAEQKMVEKFLKKIAKEFDYSMQDAARFVQDTISKMGLKESMNEEATEVTPDSKVVVDDYMLDDAETQIKSTEIVGAIVSSESEDEFLDYFYKTYGNDAFTENDISTLVAYYQEYREEVNAEEAEKEKEEEESGDSKDPLADLGI